MKFDLNALTIQTFVTSEQYDKSGYFPGSDASQIEPNPDEPDCPPSPTTSTH
jgi:hypothetical protein